jgi:hypothetical protein
LAEILDGSTIGNGTPDITQVISTGLKAAYIMVVGFISAGQGVKRVFAQ